MPIQIAFEKFRLGNGLDVILHEDHAIPVVAVNVWYHVGSQNEDPDRTGFAHLFEHIMFKGSKHHKREYFLPLQEVGANVNGSTTTDRTNYYENVPAEYLELALWLESDRMGYLLEALDEEGFATEREVVKNERRQSYENRPYGLAGIEIRKALFPPSHPYHWQTIGSQEHLDAASIEDVKAFFRRFYAPNNASLAIAGDIDVAETRRLVERYFADLPPAAPAPRIQRWTPGLDGEVRISFEDRVQLHRLWLAWVAPPRFDPDEAPLDVLVSVLSEGRSARLYRSLVHDQQVAREASARFSAMEMAGELRFDVTVAPTATVEAAERALLAELDRVRTLAPTAEEVQRAVNRIEARHVRQLESVGGFGGRANLLNYYNVFAGDPGRVNTDLDRYFAVTPDDVQRVAKAYLGPGRVRLLVTPKADVSPAPAQIDRSQQPGPGRPRDFAPPVAQRVRLTNGTDLLVVSRHSVPTIVTAIYYPAGAVDDPRDAPGISSLAARLLIEGTASRTSAQIAEESDFIAARLNLTVHRENFVASTETLTRHWSRAVDLIGDVLVNAAFPIDEVERIKRERLTDLRRLRDDPAAIADRAFLAVLYGPDSPYGHPDVGRERSIAGLTRDDIAEHYRRAVRSQRPTVIVVGDVEADLAAAEIERRLPLAPAGDLGIERAPDRPPEAFPLNEQTIFLIDKPGAAQSVIWAGHLSIPRLDRSYLPLVVMNMAFGGQFTARLNMNLREAKGYTYGYRSRFDWRRERSAFRAGGAVHTAVTCQAVEETLREFRDLVSGRPISEAEFESARLGLIRGFPPTFETPGQILGRLLDLEHFGLPGDYYSGFIDDLRAVTLADVRRATEEHVDLDHLAIVVVGDRAAIEGELQRIGLPIVHLDYEGYPLA
ncbi:MAG TPA: pitrilysin family protein [Chloroflexota bacterium]|nr:pitrilysin family protein [Chloroflexota bacterium]